MEASTMAQQLPLSQNKVALVDDADFPALSRSRWCYRPERNGNQGYAVRSVKVDGKHKKEYLHRVIMGSTAPGHEVIFLNHDRLDCRRENLRVVTIIEARRHHRVRCDSRSGAKGITFNAEYDTWSADVYRYGHCYRIGTYWTKEAAVAAYERTVEKWDSEDKDAKMSSSHNSSSECDREEARKLT
jgi:hypothetical protein